jgi:hypothetical protein
VNFHDPKDAPNVFDIVWCKWPHRESKLGPGPWVRAVLVLDVRLMIDARNENEWAAITVAYGTGAENVKLEDIPHNMVIGPVEYAAAGLHKPTVFKLDLGNRKRLPWAEEYFVPKPYVVGRGIIAGRLTAYQKVAVLAHLKARDLQFPLP